MISCLPCMCCATELYPQPNILIFLFTKCYTFKEVKVKFTYSTVCETKSTSLYNYFSYTSHDFKNRRISTQQAFPYQHSEAGTGDHRIMWTLRHKQMSARMDLRKVFFPKLVTMSRPSSALYPGVSPALNRDFISKLKTINHEKNYGDKVIFMSFYVIFISFFMSFDHITNINNFESYSKSKSKSLFVSATTAQIISILLSKSFLFYPIFTYNLNIIMRLITLSVCTKKN